MNTLKLIFLLLITNFLTAQAPHDTHLRILEGDYPRKSYESELITRIDQIHKIGYEKWINTGWATMLIKEGLIQKENIPIVANYFNETWLPTANGSFYSGFTKEQGDIIKKFGLDVGGNVMLGRVNPPGRQMFPVRHKLLKAITIIHDFQEVLIDLAEQYKDVIMPGYTHIRHAQPMTLGHYLLSVNDPIERSMEIVEKSYGLMNLNELGAGALAGTSWPIDRDIVTEYYGMDALLENANDAVGYTDGYLIVVAGLTNITNIISRLSLDLNYWSAPEFGFITLAAHRGSSFMMPQKNSNQAYMERARVGAAKMLSYLVDIAAMGMRMPHGDMVEGLHMQDGPIFALDAIDAYVHPLIKQLRGMEIHKDEMLKGARSGYSCATELTNQMMKDYDLDYRTAHKIIHNFVNESEKAGLTASEAQSKMLDKEAENIIGRKLAMSDSRLRELLDPVHFLKVTNSKGGIAVSEVERMLKDRYMKLDDARKRQIDRIEKLEGGQKLMLTHLRKYIE